MQDLVSHSAYYVILLSAVKSLQRRHLISDTNTRVRLCGFNQATNRPPTVLIVLTFPCTVAAILCGVWQICSNLTPLLWGRHWERNFCEVRH
jgi:hypothetical protein